MFCSNCGQQNEDDSKFCVKCGASLSGIQDPGRKAFTDPAAPVEGNSQQEFAPKQSKPQKNTPQTKNYTQIPKKPKNSLNMVLGIILTAVLFIGTCVLFIMRHTGIAGWLIALAVILLFWFMQLFILKKGLIPAAILFASCAVVLIATFAVTTDFKGSNVSAGSSLTALPGSGASSSLVSQGVNLNDLGNIMNGQYFFDDGKNQFYSSFDMNNAAHIYKTDKSAKTTKTIFDGFGWSFVVYQDWLYFSGNIGKQIDGTYTLYRIKTDGTNLEHLNKTYCYGLNFYNEWIYYIKADSYSSTNYSICRSQLDGSGEQVLVKDGNGYCIVYENKLYYSGKDGMIYNANPDGTNKVQIGTESVTYFIIGNGKIIFLDAGKNVKTCDIDGKNVKMIKQAGNMLINKINSYKDTIFYCDYDNNLISDKYAWKYTLHSIKADGSNDKKIYDGISNGFYINALNDHVFVLDYTQINFGTQMVAISKEMDLEGKSVTELYR